MNATPTPTEARHVAFIDIGTNSIRLLLVRINPNHSNNVLIQLKQTVRLGEGEFDAQVLQPDAIDGAISVSQQFASLIRSYDADDVIAVATAATREAKNRREFIQRLQEAAQLDVRVVSGQEEARLIYLGVSSGFHLEDKQAFFIDIGGGSTEVILGTQHHYHYLNSLRLGAIRLSAQFPAGAHGVVSPGKYSRILRYVQRHAVHTLREIRGHDIDLALGSSGTIENLADIAARRFAKRRLQRDDVLTTAHLREVVKMLGAMPLKERRRVPGLNPERADIVLAGGAILEAFMQALDIPAIRISDRGLREGLLMDYLLRHGHATALQDLSVRQRSVLDLGRTCHFDQGDLRVTIFGDCNDINDKNADHQWRLKEDAVSLLIPGTFVPGIAAYCARHVGRDEDLIAAATLWNERHKIFLQQVIHVIQTEGGLTDREKSAIDKLAFVMVEREVGGSGDTASYCRGATEIINSGQFDLDKMEQTRATLGRVMGE